MIAVTSEAQDHSALRSLADEPRNYIAFLALSLVKQYSKAA